MLSNNQELEKLLVAKVQFGHLTRRWNPKVSDFIIGEKNGIHVIDLNKTLGSLSIVKEYFKSLALAGKKIMFVGTKKQAKEVIRREATKVYMPFVVERWIGGLLTNFVAFRKLIKKWVSIDRLINSPNYKNLTKKERLSISREKLKLGVLLEGLIDVTRLPTAMFIVDINKEIIAVREARKLGIPIIAMLDTNCNVDLVDFPIPSNDDSSSSIEIIVQTVCLAISEGTKERLKNKQKTELEINDDDSDLLKRNKKIPFTNEPTLTKMTKSNLVSPSEIIEKQPFLSTPRSKDNADFKSNKLITKKKIDGKDLNRDKFKSNNFKKKQVKTKFSK